MNEWIDWEGGECPLPAGTEHEVRFRGGDVERDDEPETWNWKHEGVSYDIVAYRVVSP